MLKRSGKLAEKYQLSEQHINIRKSTPCKGRCQLFLNGTYLPNNLILHYLSSLDNVTSILVPFEYGDSSWKRSSTDFSTQWTYKHLPMLFDGSHHISKLRRGHHLSILLKCVRQIKVLVAFTAGIALSPIWTPCVCFNSSNFKSRGAGCFAGILSRFWYLSDKSGW